MRELNTKEEQQKALSESWYVRWRYRNPKTGILERMNNIKNGTNYQKTMSGRMGVLRATKKALIEVLEEDGFVPKKFRHILPQIESHEVVLGEQKEMKKDLNFGRSGLLEFSKLYQKVGAIRFE